ncbi:MAG TPA: peptidoglycan DD-metalloendopeptidase family protein [Candidatus Limnocylindrales bacterium]|nr:peptidoglycan DD-metalloendopeptidase family protein [Candidatus Limnocylindrales bacterium]
MEPGAASGYRLPFLAGRTVAVRQGWSTRYSHKGQARFAYDFALPMRTPVVAAASGVVAFTRTGNKHCGGWEARNFANLVTIYHTDGSATTYGHLSTVAVRVGDVVRAGQVIGRSGDTGFTNCQAHLHFARQVQGSAVAQSIPIYFQGYEKRRLFRGSVVEAHDESCTEDLVAAEAPAEATNEFCGEYYNGDFEGAPLFDRNDGAIDVDRSEGGPGGYWLDSTSTYSVRWRGRFDLARWWSAIRIEASGAVRVRLDGVLLVDDWVDAESVRVIELTHWPRAGIHTIEVEHFTRLPVDHIKLEFTPLPLESELFNG